MARVEYGGSSKARARTNAKPTSTPWYQRVLQNKAPAYSGGNAPANTSWAARATAGAQAAAQQIKNQLTASNRDRANAAWSARLNAEWAAYQAKTARLQQQQSQYRAQANNVSDKRSWQTAYKARQDRINQAWSDRLNAQLYYYQSYVPPSDEGIWQGGSGYGGGGYVDWGGNGGGGYSEPAARLPEWYLQGVQWRI